MTTPLGCALLVTSTARPWHLLASDGEAEDHVISPCMCFAASLRNALESWCCWPGDGRGMAMVTAAVLLFGLHLLYQQRVASLVLRPPAQPSSA
jgi:hypothetical protein